MARLCLGASFLRPHAAPPSQGFRGKTLRGAPAPPPGPPGDAVAPAAAPARRRCAGAEARNLSAQFPGPAGPCSSPCASPAGRLQLPGGRRSCAGSQLTRLSSGPAQPGLGAMYAVYKQAHPPTGLEFSMYCNFFSNSERNLVVAGTSQLYVYRLNRDAEVGPGRAGVQPPPPVSHCGLEWAPSYRPRGKGRRARWALRSPPSSLPWSPPPAGHGGLPEASLLPFFFQRMI